MKTKSITNIDEYLGDSSTRFFGEGYKKVKYHLHDKKFNNKTIDAKVSIEYPTNWSLKKKKELKPHLSSIDALIIATNLCGAVLAKECGGVAGFSVSSITIIAGRAPSLELKEILATMQLREQQMDETAGVFKLSGSVGQMKINIEVSRDHLSLGKVLDPLLTGDYLEGNFSGAKQRISDITLKHVRARASVNKNNKLLESNSIDVIDAFVSSLQLGQVLLYELDHVERANSNNLWMRSIQVTKNNTLPRSANKIITALDNLNISKVGEGEWRSASIVSKLEGIKINCSVAHQLPSEGARSVH